MTRKPISPRLHGLIDYAFSAIQVLAPVCLGLNREVIKTYQALGMGFLLTNALTDTPVALKRKISLRTHQKADIGFLTTLALLGFTPMIRRNKKTQSFHLGFLALAATHYLLTDYSADDTPLERIAGNNSRQEFAKTSMAEG